MMNFSFFVAWHFHHPLIAQLVERRTVVGFAMQTSLGRWFESGSRDSFSYWNYEKMVGNKNSAPGEARTHDLQITLGFGFIMRLTRCRLRYRGMYSCGLVQRIWSMTTLGKLVETLSNEVSMVLWCSGYHICLTRRRSPVRNRAAPAFLFHANLKTVIYLVACQHTTACSRGVVVITCASHAQGPRFDPGREQFWQKYSHHVAKESCKNISWYTLLKHSAPAWSSG